MGKWNIFSESGNPYVSSQKQIRIGNLRKESWLSTEELVENVPFSKKPRNLLELKILNILDREVINEILIK